MVQCDNPKCGAIVKKALRPMICRECGHVMQVIKEKKKKVSPYESKIEKDLKEKPEEVNNGN